MFITWDEAKRQLWEMREPSEQEVAYVEGNNDGTHEFGRNIHQLIKYTHIFYIGQFEGNYTWRVCPDCRKIINKYLVIFNNKENSSLTRELVKKGEPVY